MFGVEFPNNRLPIDRGVFGSVFCIDDVDDEGGICIELRKADDGVAQVLREFVDLLFADALLIASRLCVGVAANAVFRTSSPFRFSRSRSSRAEFCFDTESGSLLDALIGARPGVPIDLELSKVGVFRDDISSSLSA